MIDADQFTPFKREKVKMKYPMIYRPGYYVYGGEYTDTTFTQCSEKTRELYGPYDYYEHANAIWRARSFANVDNCHYRFAVLKLPSGWQDNGPLANDLDYYAVNCAEMPNNVFKNYR